MYINPIPIVKKFNEFISFIQLKNFPHVVYSGYDDGNMVQLQINKNCTETMYFLI